MWKLLGYLPREVNKMSVDGMRKLVWVAVAVLVAMTVFGIALSEINRASKSKPKPSNDITISVVGGTTSIWDWLHNQPQNTSPPPVTIPVAETTTP
jgi:ABC-type molybdate transport system substrate-binding protein